MIHGPGEAYDLATVMRIRDEQGYGISIEIRSLTAQRKDTTLRVGLSRVLRPAKFWREMGQVMNYEQTLESRNLPECDYAAYICNMSWSESNVKVDLSERGIPPSLPFCK